MIVVKIYAPSTNDYKKDQIEKTLIDSIAKNLEVEEKSISIHFQTSANISEVMVEILISNELITPITNELFKAIATDTAVKIKEIAGSEMPLRNKRKVLVTARKVFMTETETGILQLLH